MNPFVRGGGGPGGPAAAHAQRGARQWAKQWSNSPLPELPPSALAGDRATRRQGKNEPVLRACPSSHPPVRKREASKLQVNAAHRTKQQQQSKGNKTPYAHPNSHARPEPGRPSYKSVRTRAGQLHEARGGREMRMMWG